MAEAVLNAPTSPANADSPLIRITKRVVKPNEIIGRDRKYSSDSIDKDSKNRLSSESENSINECDSNISVSNSTINTLNSDKFKKK